MRDEIMRLAERAADMLDGFEQALRRYAPIEDIEEWPYHPEITDTAAELRDLALTDHAEDKLGMVPEGWGIEQHNAGYMVNPPDGPGCWASGRDDFNVPLADQTLAKLCAAMLAAAPSPNHPAGVGGMVSGDVRTAFVKGAKWWEFKSTGGTMWQSDQKLAWEAACKKYPEAALTQPADADAEGGE